MAYRLCFGSTFSLTMAPIPRVFACDIGKYAKHHGVNRCEHPTGKKRRLVPLGSTASAGRAR